MLAIRIYIHMRMLFFRSSKNYILLGGLWCSKQKPPAFTFLQPIFAHLNELEAKGLIV